MTVAQGKRPPAYAKELADARRRGLRPREFGLGHVAVVLDWDNRASGGLHRLVFPRDVDVRELDLSCLAGLRVLLTYREVDAERAAVAVDAILGAGAECVNAGNLDAFEREEPYSKVLVLFEREAAHGA